MTVSVTTIAAPPGAITLAQRDGGPVVACAFADHFDAVAARIRRVSRSDELWRPGEVPGADALTSYLDGDMHALDGLPIDPMGTAFQMRVWTALRSIPVGERWSYAQVASAADSPSAVRAVGSANAANPIWLVIPCHRVVRSDGALGGYAGGLDRKTWLLDHEDAHVSATG